MISKAHNFIFLHVPKTGGNSIQSVLLPISDDHMTQNKYQDGIDRFGIKGPVTPFKHATLADYKGILGDAVYSYKIAISVRHPLERAMSYYYMPRRWMETQNDGSILHLEPVWDREAFLSLLNEIKPASEFLCIEGAYYKPDYVIHLETLHRDFGFFSQGCDINISAQNIPHKNKSSSSNLSTQEPVSPDIISAVRDAFSKDFELFNWP